MDLHWAEGGAVPLPGEGGPQVLGEGEPQLHLVLLQQQRLLGRQRGVAAELLQTLQQLVRLGRGEEDLVRG